MKKRIRHFSKSTLSIVLSLCMLISCVSVGLIATDAAQIGKEERVGANFVSGTKIYLCTNKCSWWSNSEDDSYTKQYAKFGSGSFTLMNKERDGLFSIEVPSGTYSSVSFQRNEWNVIEVTDYDGSTKNTVYVDSSGTSGSWGYAPTTVKKHHFYFDNSNGFLNQSYKYLVVGHDNFYRLHKLNLISGTNNLYYCYNDYNWDNSLYIGVFSTSTDWQSGSSDPKDVYNKNWEGDVKANANGYKALYSGAYEFNENNSVLLQTSDASNTSTLTPTYLGSGTNDQRYAPLNYTQNIYIQETTDNGSTGTTKTLGTSVTATAKKLNGLNSTTNSALSVSASENAKSDTVARTASLSLTANDTSTYEFVGWYSASGLLSTNKTYTISSVTSEGSYYARYKIKTTTYTGINADAKGTTDGSNYTALSGTPATISATSYTTGGSALTITAGSVTGYTFAQWEVTAGAGSIADADSANTTFTPSASNTTVTAKYKKNYSITKNNPDNGTVDLNKTSAVAGESFTVTLTHGEGYKLSSLTVGGTDVTSSVSNNTYTGVAQGVNDTIAVIATFAEIPLTTIYIKKNMPTFTHFYAWSTATGEPHLTSAWPGDQFTGWSSTSDGMYYYKAYTWDCDQFKIILNNNNDKQTSDDDTAYLTGLPYYIDTAEPRTDGNDTSHPAELIQATPATYYSVAFTPAPTGGTVKVNDSETSPVQLAENSDFTILAKPAHGYTVDTVTVGTTTLTAQAGGNDTDGYTYQSHIGNADKTVTVTFKEITYTASTSAKYTTTGASNSYTNDLSANITVDGITNGKASAVSGVLLTAPDEVTVSNVKYKFAQWAATNGEFVNSIDNRVNTFKPTSDNAQAIAQYKKVYNVTATAGTGGTVTPASKEVEAGENTSFTFTPNTHYALDSITANNVEKMSQKKTTAYTYTTEAITEDTAIVGNFIAIPKTKIFVHSETDITSIYFMNSAGDGTLPGMSNWPGDAVSSTTENVNGVDFKTIEFYSLEAEFKMILVNRSVQSPAVDSNYTGRNYYVYWDGSNSNQPTVSTTPPEIKYDVTINNGDHGTVSPTTVKAGASGVTLADVVTVTPSAGWVHDGWTATGAVTVENGVLKATGTGGAITPVYARRPCYLYGKFDNVEEWTNYEKIPMSYDVATGYYFKDFKGSTNKYTNLFKVNYADNKWSAASTSVDVEPPQTKPTSSNTYRSADDKAFMFTADPGYSYRIWVDPSVVDSTTDGLKVWMTVTVPTPLTTPNITISPNDVKIGTSSTVRIENYSNFSSLIQSGYCTFELYNKTGGAALCSFTTQEKTYEFHDSGDYYVVAVPTAAGYSAPTPYGESAHSNEVHVDVSTPKWYLMGELVAGNNDSEAWTINQNYPVDTFVSKDVFYCEVTRSGGDASTNHYFRIHHGSGTDSYTPSSSSSTDMAGHSTQQTAVTASVNNQTYSMYIKGNGTFKVYVDQSESSPRVWVVPDRWTLTANAYYQTFNLSNDSYNTAQSGTTGGSVKFNSGTSALNATTDVTLGSNVTMSAVPNSGYHFDGWYTNTDFAVANRISTDADYTFAPDATRNYYALFKETVTHSDVSISADYSQVHVTVSYNGHSITNETAGEQLSVPQGAEVTVTAVLQPGCEFVGAITPALTNEKFTMPGQATTVTVNTQLSDFDLTVNLTPAGKGTVALYKYVNGQKTAISNGKAKKGDVVYVEYTTNAEDYQLQSITVSGTGASDVTMDNDYSGHFTMGYANTTINVQVVQQSEVTYFIDMHENSVAGTITIELLDAAGTIYKDAENNNCSATITSIAQQEDSTVYAAVIKTRLDVDTINIRVTYNGRSYVNTETLQLGVTAINELKQKTVKEIWLEAVNETSYSLRYQTDTNARRTVPSGSRRIYLAKPSSLTSGWTTLGLYYWGANGTTASYTFKDISHMDYLGRDADYYYYCVNVPQTVENFLFCGWSNTSGNIGQDAAPDKKTANIVAPQSTGNFFTLSDTGGSATKGTDVVIPDYTNYKSAVYTNTIPENVESDISIAPTATAARVRYNVQNPTDNIQVTVSENGIVHPNLSTAGNTGGYVNVIVTVYGTIGNKITNASNATANDYLTYDVKVYVHNPRNLEGINIMSMESITYTVNIPEVSVNNLSYQPGYFDMKDNKLKASVVVTGIQGVASASNSAIIKEGTTVNEGYTSYSVKYAKPNNDFNGYNAIKLTGATTTKSIRRDNGERFGFDHWERRTQPNSAPESVTYSTSKKIENAVETLETTQMVFDPAYTVYSAIFTSYKYVDINFTFRYDVYKPQEVIYNKETGLEATAEEIANPAIEKETKINYPYDAEYAKQAGSHETITVSVNNYEVRGKVSPANNSGTKISGDNLITDAMKALGSYTKNNTETLLLNNNYYDYQVKSTGISIGENSVYNADVTVNLTKSPKTYNVYLWNGSNWDEQDNPESGTPGFTYQAYADITINNDSKWYAVSEDKSTANAPLLASGKNYRFRVKGDTYLVTEAGTVSDDAFNRSEVDFSHYEIVHKEKVIDQNPQMIEYLRQNFYIADFFAPSKVFDPNTAYNENGEVKYLPYDEVKFVGGGVVYYSVTNNEPFANALSSGYVRKQKDENGDLRVYPISSNPGTGDNTFKFVDNQGWSTVYLYAYAADDTALASGTSCGTYTTNAQGKKVFTITVPDNTAYIVLKNSNESEQTVRITNFDVEGYCTLTQDGAVNPDAIKEMLKSKIEAQYAEDNLAGAIGEEDAMKAAYGTEIPVTKNVEGGFNTGIFYRYLPMETYTRDSNGKLVQENGNYTLDKTTNVNTFRYSNTLQSYQYVYASGNENKATNNGKNMRLYSYYVYSYVTYNQDTNLPETKYEVVLSDNYADASTYWAGN